MSMNPNEDIGYIIGDTENCLKGGTVKEFWMPVVQGSLVEDQYLWLDDREGYNITTPMTSLNWKKSEPNGLHAEPCVSALLLDGEYLWNDDRCHTPKCSICDMPVIQTFRLRGPNLFDHEYLLSLDMQKNSSSIRFEGVESSWIIWDPLEEKTKIMDIRYDYSTHFDKNPFGLIKPKTSISPKEFNPHQWVFTNVSSKESSFNQTIMSVHVFSLTVQPK